MKAVVVVALCCALQIVSAYRKKVIGERLELRDGCRDQYVDVDEWDEVLVKSMRQQAERHSVSAGAACTAFFKTTLPDQGLCFHKQGVLIRSPNFRIEFITEPYGPDRIVKRGSQWSEDLCFPHSLVAVRVATSHADSSIDENAIYAFTVTNDTIDSIPKHYFMDSFAECDRSHSLTSGQEMHVEFQRDPPVTSDPPSTCELTFDTSAEDEYEQVCVELQVLPSSEYIFIRRDTSSSSSSAAAAADSNSGDDNATKKPATTLQIEGLNNEFYSTGEAMNGVVSCSAQKRLKLILKRNKEDPLNYKVTVTSQWHPLWEKEATETAEMAGLRVVKGITYFIATIDILVAIMAASLAAILKRPAGPWRRWAEHFNAQAAAHAPQSYPPVDPANYGSMHTCKDGNYPELPLEGATPVLRERNEVLVEAHTY